MKINYDTALLYERIDRLERTLAVLMDAMDRKDTERDGNWGYPSFREELRGLRFWLADVPRVVPKLNAANGEENK